MRISYGPAVAGEMLAGGGHTGGVHATDEGTCQQRGTLGVAFEGTTADHRAALIVEVQHRGETQIEADRQYFSGHDPAALLGQVFGIRRSEEHTSELQSLMRISYAVLSLK